MTQASAAPEVTARTRWHPPRLWVIIGLLAAVLAAGGFGLWRYASDAGDPAANRLTAVATRADIEDTITATGTLQPKDYVDVGTQVSGQLKIVSVAIGTTVSAGQLLAEIDPSVYQSKVDADQAQLLNQGAQIADRKAQLVLASLQLRREQNMTRDNATSADALQSAEATQQSAAAQVAAFQAQRQQTESTLRGDQANLGYTKIYAPIAGTVVSQAAKQGQTLNANQQAPVILRIADLATMTVQAQVSEADVSKLQVGMDVYFTTLGGSKRRYYGTLRQIPPTPTVVNNVVLYDALFDVENPERRLMTQMTAQVFFVAAAAKDAVVVPLAALHAPVVTVTEKAGPKGAHSARRVASADPRNQFGGGHAIVTVIDGDGQASERAVEVGVVNRVMAQITSGLEPGESVVVGVKSPATAERAKPASGGLTPGAAQGGGGPGQRP